VNRAISQNCFFFLVRQNWGGCRYSNFAVNFKGFLGAMDPWTGAQSAFAVKAFYKNGDSFGIVKRELLRGFGIHRNPSVLVIKTCSAEVYSGRSEDL
jgi:hypothetical protein